MTLIDWGSIEEMDTADGQAAIKAKFERAYSGAHIKPHLMEEAVKEDYAVNELRPATHIDHLDPSRLLSTFSHYEPQIADMEVEVKAVKVTNEPTAARAVSMAGQTRKLRNEIKKAVDAAFRPVNDYKNAISDVTGKLIKRLEAMTSALEAANRAYLVAEDNKRREAARKAEEEARKARESAEAAARAEAAKQAEALNVPVEQIHVAPAFVPAVVMPPTETKITTAEGSMKIEYEMVPEIADFRLLPAECLQARTKEITAAVMPWIKARGKAGIHNDPGIIWTRQPKTQTRVGR